MKTVTILIVAIVCGSVGLTQTPKVQVKSAKRTSAASGREMYVNYCASCHGANAKGDGPAAMALKHPPADLTKLAASHGGKYPSDYVAKILEEGTPMTSHGSSDMPVWGPVFRAVGTGGQEEVRLRIYNLNKYLASLNADNAMRH
ncbi:MAG: c-type cytochrome [Terriglobales bacterium]